MDFYLCLALTYPASSVQLDGEKVISYTKLNKVMIRYQLHKKQTLKMIKSNNENKNLAPVCTSISSQHKY